MYVQVAKSSGIQRKAGSDRLRGKCAYWFQPEMKNFLQPSAKSPSESITTKYLSFSTAPGRAFEAVDPLEEAGAGAYSK